MINYVITWIVVIFVFSTNSCSSGQGKEARDLDNSEITALGYFFRTDNYVVHETKEKRI